MRAMRISAFLFTLLAFVAQPVAAASSPSLTSLEQQLHSMVAGKSADVGIAALDLNSGETVSIKGSTPFPMASTVKVAVAALYLAQVDNGRRSRRASPRPSRPRAALRSGSPISNSARGRAIRSTPCGCSSDAIRNISSSGCLEATQCQIFTNGVIGGG